MAESSQEHQRIFLILVQHQYEKNEIKWRTEGQKKLTGIKIQSEQKLQACSKDKLH